MSKKLIGVALAVAMTFGVAATAMAAVNMKIGGFIRYRGVTVENQDRLKHVAGSDLGRDTWRYYDHVFRPYFIATYEDKARAYFQLDIPSWGQVGGEGGRNFGTGFLSRDIDEVRVVNYNLQVKLPWGNGWFFRIGRDNVFLPRGLVGRLPNLREFGLQVWGKVGAAKVRLETYKRDETSNSTLGLDVADDDDVYIAKISLSPMKGVRMQPYFVFHRANRTATSAALVNMFYPGIELSARYRNFTGKVDFVFQTGDIDYTVADGTSDKDVEAWVVWTQVSAKYGAATVSFNYVAATGDNDQADTEENQFFAIGCAFTDGVGCDARSQGPSDMWFGDKYNDTATVGSRNIGGNTGGTGGRYARGNGTQTYSIDVSYRASKKLLLQGTIAGIYSMFMRPDLSANGDNAFKTSRHIGTEINLSSTYSLYKGVSFTGGFDYLAAGDYGELKTEVADASQVAGGTTRLVNSNADSWQAVWKLQWFF